MKKTMQNRFIALALVCVMAMSALVGCNSKGNEELKNALQGETTSTNTNVSDNSSTGNKNSSNELTEIQAQLSELAADLESTTASLEEVEGKMAALEVQNTELKDQLTAANAEKVDLQNKLSAANAENANLEAENVELEAFAEKLKEQIAAVHPIVVRENVLWVHIDDFLNAADGVGAIINSQDGTGYALRTLKGIHVKVYDDEHGDEHLIPNFDLPMLDKYTIILTNDEGKTAFTASFGNYNWANRGLVTSFASCSFAKELTSMTKNGGAGNRFYDLIKATAVVVEENGTYRFAVDSGEYGANPVVKPAEPEVVVKEIKVCMICGKEDCTGHVETKVETETVKVCMICGKEDCTGHVEIKVETETVKICMICGKEDCTGHVETKVETETVKVCMICGKEDCTGHVETKLETETVYVPGETIYIPGEKIEYCGRCDNLMENCTCSDSDHNDLEDLPNPNEPVDDVKPGHNELEEIQNPNDKETSSDHNTTDSSHSSLGSSSGNGSSGSSSKKSSHSPLD